MQDIDKAIIIFNKVRDIPYHISTQGEAGFDCEDKAKILVDELCKLGFEARVRVGLFKWSKLRLPESITSKPHHDDCSHMFVEFQNEAGEWIYIDPTWNKELLTAGFPAVEWDGVSPTRIAVRCDVILEPEESLEYLEKIDRKSDMRDNGEFYEAFNSYCDSFLTKGAK